MRKLVEDERRRPGIACDSELQIHAWMHDKRRTAWGLKLILDDIGRMFWLDEVAGDRRTVHLATKARHEFRSYVNTIRLSELLEPSEIVSVAKQMLRGVFSYAYKDLLGVGRSQPPISVVKKNPDLNGFAIFNFEFNITCEVA